MFPDQAIRRIGDCNHLVEPLATPELHSLRDRLVHCTPHSMASSLIFGHGLVVGRASSVGGSSALSLEDNEISMLETLYEMLNLQLISALNFKVTYRIQEFSKNVHREWIPIWCSWFPRQANIIVLFANETLESRKFELAKGSNPLQLSNETVLDMIMFRGPV